MSAPVPSAAARCQVMEATVQDSACIASLARRVFSDTFEAVTPPDDMAAFLDTTYRPELFTADIESPAQTVLVARHGEQVIGFLQLREGPAPGCVRGEKAVELQRLYVDPDWHGAGAAQALMARASDEARQRGFATWWLGVWENNLRAQRFYRKYGFEERGSHIFQVGHDAQKDLLLEAPLEKSAPPRLEN